METELEKVKKTNSMGKNKHYAAILKSLIERKMFVTETISEKTEELAAINIALRKLGHED